MKHTLLLSVMLLGALAAFCPSSSSAQLLRRGNGLPRAQRVASTNVSQRLEAPMPFAEAVQRAKDGDGAGMYAVAIHYALGKEIVGNAKLAREYMSKGAAAGNPSAVFVDAMLSEEELDLSLPEPPGQQLWSRRHSASDINDNIPPSLAPYTGGAHRGVFLPGLFGPRSTTSISNVADIAAVRTKYEKSVALGVTGAKHELERFEKRMTALREAYEKALKDIESLEANARLAEEVLGVPPSVEKQAAKAAEERAKAQAEREKQSRDLKEIQRELQRQRASRTGSPLSEKAETVTSTNRFMPRGGFSSLRRLRSADSASVNECIVRKGEDGLLALIKAYDDANARHQDIVTNMYRHVMAALEEQGRYSVVFGESRSDNGWSSGEKPLRVVLDCDWGNYSRIWEYDATGRLLSVSPSIKWEAMFQKYAEAQCRKRDEANERVLAAAKAWSDQFKDETVSPFNVESELRSRLGLGPATLLRGRPSSIPVEGNSPTP